MYKKVNIPKTPVNRYFQPYLPWVISDSAVWLGIGKNKLLRFSMT